MGKKKRLDSRENAYFPIPTVIERIINESPTMIEDYVEGLEIARSFGLI